LRENSLHFAGKSGRWIGRGDDADEAKRSSIEAQLGATEAQRSMRMKRSA
jgi:hypothetical protein